MRRFLIACLSLVWMAGALAQPAKGTAALDKTGGWLFFNSRNSNFRVFDALGPGDPSFPEITNSSPHGSFKPDDALKDKLTQLRDIFKAAYPNPQGHSIVYSISTRGEKSAEFPRPLTFKIYSHGLEHDGKGGLTPLNLESSQGDQRFAGSAESLLIASLIMALPCASTS